jgi:hypothetical protein
MLLDNGSRVFGEGKVEVEEIKSDPEGERRSNVGIN